MVTVAVFEGNADLRARLATKALPTREFIEVNIGGGYSKWTLFFTKPLVFCPSTNRLVILSDLNWGLRLKFCHEQSQCNRRSFCNLLLNNSLPLLRDFFFFLNFWTFGDIYPWVSSQSRSLACYPQIHLWCDTCWLSARQLSLFNPHAYRSDDPENYWFCVFFSAGQAEIFIPPNHAEGDFHPLLIYAWVAPSTVSHIEEY